MGVTLRSLAMGSEVLVTRPVDASKSIKRFHALELKQPG